MVALIWKTDSNFILPSRLAYLLSPLGGIRRLLSKFCPSHSEKRSFKNLKRNVSVSIMVEGYAHVRHPHDDALVITTWVATFNAKIVLADIGISIGILVNRAFVAIRFEDFCLETNSRNGSRPKGLLTHIFWLSTFLRQVMKEILFVVVDFPSSCNIIFCRCRHLLNAFRAALRTIKISCKDWKGRKQEYQVESIPFTCSKAPR